MEAGRKDEEKSKNEGQSYFLSHGWRCSDWHWQMRDWSKQKHKHTTRKRETKFKVQSSLDKHKVSLRNKWLSMFFFLVTFFSTLCSSARLTLSVSVFFGGLTATPDLSTREERKFRGDKIKSFLEDWDPFTSSQRRDQRSFMSTIKLRARIVRPRCAAVNGWWKCFH